MSARIDRTERRTESGGEGEGDAVVDSQATSLGNFVDGGGFHKAYGKEVQDDSEIPFATLLLTSCSSPIPLSPKPQLHLMMPLFGTSLCFISVCTCLQHQTMSSLAAKTVM